MLIRYYVSVINSLSILCIIIIIIIIIPFLVLYQPEAM
jgi:hypothetical protein